MNYRKQIHLGYNADGKRVRKWISANSQKELKRKEKELLMNVSNHMTSSMRFVDYYDKWVMAYKAHLEKGTLFKYTTQYRNCLKPLHGMPLKDIKRSHVQNIVNEQWDRPVQCRMVYQTIKAVLKAAAADGLVIYQDYNLQMPSVTRSERRILTSEEKAVILSIETFNEQERLFVRLSMYLGLRPEETRALTRTDFKDGNILINKALAYSGALQEGTLKGTKTGKVRTLPMPDVLIEEVTQYLAHHKTMMLFPGVYGSGMHKAEFQTFQANIRRKINKALNGDDKLNVISGITLYTFRHTRATELYYTDGISTKLAAYYMGHSEMEFIRTYSHLDDEKEAIEKLRAVI